MPNFIMNTKQSILLVFLLICLGVVLLDALSAPATRPIEAPGIGGEKIRALQDVSPVPLQRRVRQALPNQDRFPGEFELQALQPSKTFSFKVQVVDHNGQAIEGATVNAAGKSVFPSQNFRDVRWPKSMRANHRKLAERSLSVSSLTDSEGYAPATIGIVSGRSILYIGNVLEGTITAASGGLYGELHIRGVPREIEKIVVHSSMPFKISCNRDQIPVRGVPISLTYSILEERGEDIVRHKINDFLGRTNAEGLLVFHQFEDRMREISRGDRKVASLALKVAIPGMDLSRQVSFSELASGGVVKFDLLPSSGLRIKLYNEGGFAYKEECMVAILDNDPTEMLEKIGNADLAHRALIGKLSGEVIWTSVDSGKSEIFRGHMASNRAWYVFGVVGRLAGKVSRATILEGSEGMDLGANVIVPSPTIFKMRMLNRTGTPFTKSLVSIQLRTKKRRVTKILHCDDSGNISFSTGEILPGETVTHIKIDGRVEIERFGVLLKQM